MMSQVVHPDALEPGPTADAVPYAAEEIAGVSRRTLEKYRGLGTGQPFLKLGRRVLYTVAVFEAWIYAVASGRQRTIDDRLAPFERSES